MRNFRLLVGLWVVVAAILFCPAAHCAPSAPSAEIEQTARWLASQQIRYASPWLPPGETRSWKMDCSNTVRWLHRELYGRALPRTASAQYTALRERGKFRRVRAHPASLAKVLRPGDLLFWEHTYRPRRKPPVTHVMMYLGRDRAGKMWMVGAQPSRGVGIYEFRPQARMGGYRWFLWFRREGRFIGYARP